MGHHGRKSLKVAPVEGKLNSLDIIRCRKVLGTKTSRRSFSKWWDIFMPRAAYKPHYGTAPSEAVTPKQSTCYDAILDSGVSMRTYRR